RYELVERFEDPFPALLPAHFRIGLPAQNAAYRARAAEAARDANHVRLPLDFALAPARVGRREVGRAAEHRHGETSRLNGFADAVEITVLEAREEAFVHFEAVGVELLGHFNPFEDGHAATCYFFQIALWESRDVERHLGFEDSFDVLAALHFLEAVVPFGEGGDAANDRIEANLSGDDHGDYPLPDG